MNISRIKILVFLCFLSFLSFSQNVKKVISLAPSITENIYLLGAQDRLVGCTSYCTQAVADQIQTIGSTIDVNVEKIFALQPDLVLTMEMTKSQDLEAMKKIGLNVVVIPTPKSFDEICEQTMYIGKLIGSEKAAQKVIQETKTIVNDIQMKSAQLSNKPKVFFQIGASPIFTVLQNTFMDDFILITNGENIANGLTKGTMTRESILVKNPDVIIIASMGGFGKEEQMVWNNFKGITAVKNNKVFIIPSETSCSPTPVNFAKALTDVFQFINQ
jgi:ABC-type Fe3+-hydroxamate transport system substrate-binding protein